MPKKKIIRTQTVTEIVPERPIENVPIGGVVTMNYDDFCRYVINHRAVPTLYDGMKDSYRRLLWSAILSYKEGTMSPAVDLVNAVARWHPHSVDGLDGTMSLFVHSGVFIGEGTFGSVNIADGEKEPCAALRYLHISLSPVYNKLLKDLIKEVPQVESPNGPTEPLYIPLPLPLSCCLKADVMGLTALKTTIPSFTPKSLYQAYIHDDPNLLEVNSDINIDKANSELHKLWNTGKGKITYYFKATPCKGPDGRSEGVMFEGDTWKFVPNWKNEKYRKLLEDGKIFQMDLTDINGPKVFLGKVPDARGITVDDVINLAKEIYFTTIPYEIYVTSEESAKPIPLKIWIDIVYKNYINLLLQVNKKKIARCEFLIKVQEMIPTFGSYILSNPKASKEQIKKDLKIDDEMLTELLGKTLSTILQTPENSAKLNNLKKELEELKKFDPIKETEGVINQM